MELVHVAVVKMRSRVVATSAQVMKTAFVLPHIVPLLTYSVCCDTSMVSELGSEEDRNEVGEQLDCDDGAEEGEQMDHGNA